MVTTNRSVPAGPAMRAQDVFDVLDLAASVEATIWLDGGWGVDALLGHQTRPHADLDITVEEHHVPALEDLLSERGFRRVDRAHERPWNFILADRVGRRIDVHVVVLDNAGNGIYGPPGNAEQYPAASLTGRGSVEGRVVQCISPEWMVQFHTGYAVDDTDWADVSALCSRFALPIPADYQRWVDARECSGRSDCPAP